MVVLAHEWHTTRVLRSDAQRTKRQLTGLAEQT